MNRTVHDVLALWRQAERLQESLPEGSTARVRVAMEALRLQVAYREITDPAESSSEISSRCDGIVGVVAHARAAMCDVEQSTDPLPLAAAGGKG
jgi:hypothetical protein